MKRSGKFYYSNEKKVMKALGFNSVPGSGSGWILKEDGESDTALVQLKSTDSSRYTLDMLDMKKLEYHADVSNKIPIFLVQFLKQDRIYAIVDITNIHEASEAIKTRKTQKVEKITQISSSDFVGRKTVKASTSTKSRDKFFEERSKSFERKKRSN